MSQFDRRAVECVERFSNASLYTLYSIPTLLHVPQTGCASCLPAYARRAE